MYQSEDYFVLQLHRAGEERLLHELELRRVVAERVAETAEAGEGVTDAPRPRRGIRALLPRRLRQVQPPRPAMP